jgi:phytoene synthase
MAVVAPRPEIERAYEHCREIARRAAKNFYYSFRVLPKAKSDAMCAVYAFMRRADDIADDESLNVDERRVIMQRWLAEWRGSRQVANPDDPVFLALGDAQRRFGIPDALLEDLVRGTTMDLDPLSHVADGRVDLGDGFQGYRTFADLYRYCYLVASVVGLVTIKIFGYTDRAAELLAEKTGVAFQLTNILRDVKEDAERKRIYLPQDLLAEFHVTNADLLALSAGRPMQANERAMLLALSARAREYYASAKELLPMVDADSRGALWVLVTIYSKLLQEIDHRRGDVFSERVSVSTRSKLLILARGAAMSLRMARR